MYLTAYNAIIYVLFRLHIPAYSDTKPETFGHLVNKFDSILMGYFFQDSLEFLIVSTHCRSIFIFPSIISF